MTDPVRTPDPVEVAARLPRGAAVIHRTFGAPDALATALALRRLTRRHGLLLLIGADEALATRVGADGLHLPERRVAELPRIRARHPGWILTGAAHSRRALFQAEAAGADAILLSAVFPSRSPTAPAPLGPARFARWVRSAKAPVLALGGVNASTAQRLVGTGAAGLAAVDAWLG